MMKNSEKNFLKEMGKFILEVVYNIAFIVILVIIIRNFVISPFSVHGASMMPTLEDKEFILINKFSYHLSKPDRGDVVVFLPPVTGREEYIEKVVTTDETGKVTYDVSDEKVLKNAPYCQKTWFQKFWFCQGKITEDDLLYIIPKDDKSLTESSKNMEKRQVTKEEAKNKEIQIEGEPNKEYVLRIYSSATKAYFVKRVIGIPGDKVRIENGLVYLKKSEDENFNEINEPYLSEQNKNHTFFQTQPESNEFTVPEGHYFVLGDNRTNSSDSREWEDPVDETLPTPFVAEDQIAGKVGVVLLPLLDIRLIKSADL